MFLIIEKVSGMQRIADRVHLIEVTVLIDVPPQVKPACVERLVFLRRVEEKEEIYYYHYYYYFCRLALKREIES